MTLEEHVLCRALALRIPDREVPIRDSDPTPQTRTAGFSGRAARRSMRSSPGPSRGPLLKSSTPWSPLQGYLAHKKT